MLRYRPHHALVGCIPRHLLTAVDSTFQHSASNIRHAIAIPRTQLQTDTPPPSLHRLTANPAFASPTALRLVFLTIGLAVTIRLQDTTHRSASNAHARTAAHSATAILLADIQSYPPSTRTPRFAVRFLIDKRYRSPQAELRVALLDDVAAMAAPDVARRVLLTVHRSSSASSCPFAAFRYVGCVSVVELTGPY